VKKEAHRRILRYRPFNRLLRSPAHLFACSVLFALASHPANGLVADESRDAIYGDDERN
jgi:hypothetical protein